MVSRYRYDQNLFLSGRLHFVPAGGPKSVGISVSPTTTFKAVSKDKS